MPDVPGFQGRQRTVGMQTSGLGDVIESALSAVGVTKERVEAFVGRPCGCRERQEKLNALGAWAKRVVGGKVEKAKEYLEGILGSS